MGRSRMDHQRVAVVCGQLSLKRCTGSGHEWVRVSTGSVKNLSSAEVNQFTEPKPGPQPPPARCVHFVSRNALENEYFMACFHNLSSVILTLQNSALNICPARTCDFILHAHSACFSTRTCVPVSPQLERNSASAFRELERCQHLFGGLSWSWTALPSLRHALFCSYIL